MGKNNAHKKQISYSLTNRYDTEEKCKDLFAGFLWRNGISCPHCGALGSKDETLLTILSKERAFCRCSNCNEPFTVLVNWFLSGSKISYMKWLKAIENIAFSKGSISAQELANKLEIGIKTARKMILIINKLVPQDAIKLKNVIEVDETYVGGIEQKKHMSRRTPYTDKVVGDKIPMFGMIERNIYEDTGYKTNWKGLQEKRRDKIKYHGKIVLQTLDIQKEHKVRRADVVPLIKKFSTSDQDIIFYHDANRIYRGDEVFQGRKHKEIIHSLTTKKKNKVKDKDKKEKSNQPHYERYVKNVEQNGVVIEKISTNSVEGMFGQFKREIVGTHHSLSKKYIQSYADMFCFRWNTRGIGTDEKLSLLFQNIGDSAMTKKDIFPDGPTGRMTKAERKNERHIQKSKKKVKKMNKEQRAKHYAEKKQEPRLRKEIYNLMLGLIFMRTVENGRPIAVSWGERITKPFAARNSLPYKKLIEFKDLLTNLPSIHLYKSVMKQKKYAGIFKIKYLD